jgi:thiamine-phosphate pyrophosphorylase
MKSARDRPVPEQRDRQAEADRDELGGVWTEAAPGTVHDRGHKKGDQSKVDQIEVHRTPSIRLADLTPRQKLAAARLYAITPDAEPAGIESRVAAYLRGGADIIQLRHKTLARGALLELAQSLAARVQAAGALFIVNDHLDIALLTGADGVHLGPDDLSPAAARRVAGPGPLIGASAASPEAATQAEEHGVDYLGSGPAFATPLKPEKGVIGPARVAAVAATVKIPVFAIGGIGPDNLDQLLALGLDRVCVIRSLSEAADPEATTRLLKARLQP